MPNLLDETKEAIKEHGYIPSDIVFIGDKEPNYQYTWDEYQVLANKEYDNGYVGSNVASDLTIIFQDGNKLCRKEYDEFGGKDWWELEKPSVQATKTKSINYLFTNDWERLHEINH